MPSTPAFSTTNAKPKRPRGRPKAEVTVGEILDQYIEDCELRGVRSVQDARERCNKIRSIMGEFVAADVDARAVRDLQLALVRARPRGSTGSVNTIVGTLKTALRLAADNGVIAQVPHFPRRLKSPPPRQGFLEHGEFCKIMEFLPGWAKDAVAFLYYSAWRVNEALTLCWEEVSLEGGVIRLNPSRSKNGESRLCPIAGGLAEILARRARVKRKDTPLVFYRVRRKSWTRPRRVTPILSRTLLEHFQRAGVKAGHPGLFVHDLRRTAIRNMVRAGVPEVVAMKLSGHRNRGVFDRYNIVAEDELAGAAEKVKRYLDTKAEERRGPVVVPFKRK